MYICICVHSLNEKDIKNESKREIKKARKQSDTADPLVSPYARDGDVALGEDVDGAP